MKKIFLALLVLVSSVSFGQNVSLKGGIGYSQSCNVMQYGAKGDGTTDDTAPIQLAINDCDSKGGGYVDFPDPFGGFYKISGALQTSISGTNPNSQLYIPSHALSSPLRNVIIFRGISMNHFQSGYSPGLTVPLFTTGVILRSTLASASGTNPSVIGSIGTTGNYQNINYTDVGFENICIQVYTNSGAAAPVLSGINMFYVAKRHYRNVIVTLDCTLQVSSSPASSQVCGIIDGQVNDDGPNTFESTWVSGFKYGYAFSEHTTLNNVYATGNYFAALIQAGNFTIDGKFLIHACPHGLYAPNSTIMGIAAGKAYVNLTIESELDSASSPFGALWYKTQDNVTDSGNNIYGNISIQNISGDGLATNLSHTITKYGGTNLFVKAYQDAYGGGGGSAGGSDKAIQYDSLGSFGGDASKLFYNYTTGNLDQKWTKNGILNITNTNLSSGTGAYTQVIVNANSFGTTFGQTGSGTTGFDLIAANTGYLYTGSPKFAIEVDNASGKIVTGIGASPSTPQWTQLASGAMLFNTQTDNNASIQIGANSTTKAQIFLNGSAADVTSPTEGMLWYNSTTKQLQFRSNVTTNLLQVPAIGNPITSATAGTLFFAGTGGTLQQSNSILFYDSTNNRLGIGTNAPAVAFHVKKTVNGNLTARVENNSTGSSAQTVVELINDNAQYIDVGVPSSTKAAYGNLAVNSPFFYTAATGGMHFMVDAAGKIDFATGTGAPAPTRMTIASGGDVSIGTTTDNGLLTVAGIVVPEANLTRDFGTTSFAWRNLYLNHIITAGSAPAFHTGSLGTNVTSITPTGTDGMMHVVIVTSGAVSGSIGSIDFNTAWPLQPKVAGLTCTSNSTGGGAVPIMATCTSTTLLVLSGVIAGAGTYGYDIHIVQ